MDDFVSNNVNAFSGQLVLCDSYVPRLYPQIVEQVAEGAPCYFFTPEACHIDQLGFKLTTVFRLGRVTKIKVLTKDGSPHSLQIPLVVQEAAINADFAPDRIRFFVVEKGQLFEVSHESVRKARHLSEIEVLLAPKR
jgi:hypothetical protein